MKNKEQYRRNLPHFQQLDQAFFITVNLKDAIPSKALSRYTLQLNMLKDEIALVKKDKTKAMLLPELEKDYLTLRKKYKSL